MADIQNEPGTTKTTIFPGARPARKYSAEVAQHKLDTKKFGTGKTRGKGKARTAKTRAARIKYKGAAESFGIADAHFPGENGQIIVYVNSNFNKGARKTLKNRGIDCKLVDDMRGAWQLTGPSSAVNFIVSIPGPEWCDRWEYSFSGSVPSIHDSRVSTAFSRDKNAQVKVGAAQASGYRLQSLPGTKPSKQQITERLRKLRAAQKAYFSDENSQIPVTMRTTVHGAYLSVEGALEFNGETIPLHAQIQEMKDNVGGEIPEWILWATENINSIDSPKTDDSRESYKVWADCGYPTLVEIGGKKIDVIPKEWKEYHYWMERNTGAVSPVMSSSKRAKILKKWAGAVKLYQWAQSEASRFATKTTKRIDKLVDSVLDSHLNRV